MHGINSLGALLMWPYQEMSQHVYQTHDGLFSFVKAASSFAKTTQRRTNKSIIMQQIVKKQDTRKSKTLKIKSLQA